MAKKTSIVNLYQFQMQKDYFKKKFPQFKGRWKLATIGNVSGLRCDIIRYFGNDKPGAEIFHIMQRACKSIEWYLEERTFEGKYYSK